MKSINYMYYIYEGFEKEVAHIFKTTIDKYNLRLVRSSDYGAVLENENCRLDISYETGLQFWITDIKSDTSIMLFKTLRDKKIDYGFIKGGDKKEKLGKINEVLVKYFEDEFNGSFKK